MSSSQQSILLNQLMELYQINDEFAPIDEQSIIADQTMFDELIDLFEEDLKEQPSSTSTQPPKKPSKPYRQYNDTHEVVNNARKSLRNEFDSVFEQQIFI